MNKIFSAYLMKDEILFGKFSSWNFGENQKMTPPKKKQGIKEQTNKWTNKQQ